MVNLRKAEVLSFWIADNTDVWESAAWRQITGYEKAPVGPHSKYDIDLPGVSEIDRGHLETYFTKIFDLKQENKSGATIRDEVSSMYGDAVWNKLGARWYKSWGLNARFTSVASQAGLTVYTVAKLHGSTQKTVR